MKIIFGLLIITGLGSYKYAHQTLVKKIKLGEWVYLIYKKSAYLHENRWNVEYFVVYRSGLRKRMCSSYSNAKRNDSIFVSGNYSVYKDKIEFVQHYYYNKDINSTDSVKNTFYPDKIGNLILRESTMFGNKQKTTKVYK